MFLSDKTMKLLVESGLEPDTLVAILQSLRADEEAARPVDVQAERRRAKDRERKALRKPQNSAESAESAEILPKEKVSPTPPSKTQTILTPSPPKGGSVPKKPTDEKPFERFWSSYPRKIGKGAARRAFATAWRKLPALAEEEILCGALERAKAAWDDPQFIPHAATWLNGERWTDEIEPPKPKEPESGFARWLAVNRPEQVGGRNH